MNNLLSCVASWATLILFLFYFVGRIITILTVKRIWKEKVVFAECISDEYGVVDEVGNQCEYGAFLISTEGMRNIKIYDTDLKDVEKSICKNQLIYERGFLNINQAIRINVETGEIFPTLIIEYETMNFMKVELKWYDNLKNGVYSEMVVPRNTLKSVIYQLLK